MTPESQKRPTIPDRVKRATTRHNALVYARQHLATHMDWARYLEAGGELPAEEVGDLEHQTQAIAELNVICAALRDSPPTADPCSHCDGTGIEPAS